MHRGRCWRRWRAEVVEDRFFQYRRLLEAGRSLYATENRPAFTYNKRVSPDEIVEVNVWNRDDQREWLRYVSRKTRDTRTPCSCWYCCTPRRSPLHKPKEHDRFGDRRRGGLACDGILRTAFGDDHED